MVLSYYPCPALVQPHHTPFVPDVFSSPCCFQDMPINLSALWVDILVSLWWPPLGAFVLSCLRTGTWAPVFVRRCISVTLTVSHSLWVFNVYASHRFVGNQPPPVVSEKFRIEFFHYINLYKNYRINVILSNPEKNVCFFFWVTSYLLPYTPHLTVCMCISHNVSVSTHLTKCYVSGPVRVVPSSADCSLTETFQFSWFCFFIFFHFQDSIASP